jgi:hypothetical protein
MPEPFPPVGMPPAVWGPILWTTMHIVTLGYSETPTEHEQKAAIEFFESLVYMIPCPICKEHYKMILEKHPVAEAVKSRSDLANWVFMIHNKVNEQLGKPQFTMEQYLQNLQVFSKMKRFQMPPPEQIVPHSLPIHGAIGLLAGVGIGAAALYLYQKYTR